MQFPVKQQAVAHHLLVLLDNAMSHTGAVEGSSLLMRWCPVTSTVRAMSGLLF